MAKTSQVTLDRQESVTKPTLDEIAEEAYAIYLANGSQHGFDIDHWLEAERRIAARKALSRRTQDVAADRPGDRDRG